MIWGAATPVIKFTLQGIDPIPFLTYRFLISAVIGIIIISLLYKKQSTLIKQSWKKIFAYGLLASTFALGLLFLGLDKTTVLDTILIAAISPLVIAYFGVHFLKEKITKQEKIGLGIALFGTLITILEPLFDGGGKEFIQLSGNLLVFGYLISDASSSVIAKKLDSNGLNPFVLVSFSFIIGFISILPVALYLQPSSEIIHSITAMELKYHLGVWYMAVLSGTLAYTLFVIGINNIEVSEAGVFAYLNPIFAAPLAVVWLGEEITYPFIFGAVIIAIGVFIAETRKQAPAENVNIPRDPP